MAGNLVEGVSRLCANRAGHAVVKLYTLICAETLPPLLLGLHFCRVSQAQFVAQSLENGLKNSGGLSLAAIKRRTGSFIKIAVAPITKKGFVTKARKSGTVGDLSRGTVRARLDSFQH